MTESPHPSVSEHDLQRINQRWAQLHALEHEYTLAGLRFLLYSNAGGAIAVLGLIGAETLDTSDSFVRWALFSFVTGVVLYGASVLVLYFRVVSIHAGFRQDVDKRFDGSLSQDAFNANDLHRSGESIIDYLAPFGSLFCFVDGCVLGCYALIQYA